MALKTYKRETAWGLLGAFWGAVGAIGAGIVPITHLPALSELLGVLGLPVHMFAGLAFGLDWGAKQGPYGPKK